MKLVAIISFASIFEIAEVKREFPSVACGKQMVGSQRKFAIRVAFADLPPGTATKFPSVVTGWP